MTIDPYVNHLVIVIVLMMVVVVVVKGGVIVSLMETIEHVLDGKGRGGGGVIYTRRDDKG